jgi:hypothetical protein
VLDQFRESQRLRPHSAIMNVDVFPQSSDRLQRCRFFEGIERSDDDSPVLSRLPGKSSNYGIRASHQRLGAVQTAKNLD